MDDTIPELEQDEVIAFLETGQAFGPDDKVERIDTHAASVFLAGDRAWKLKRAVRFDYLDFSSADKRRAALQTELHLNRRTAPRLYRAVHPITRDAAGRLAIDGEGEAVDWLLEMQRFPDDALLAGMADKGQLDEPLLIRLADHIHGFHQIAGIVPVKSGADVMRAVVAGNAVSMAAFPDVIDPAKAAWLERQLQVAIDGVAALLDARAAAGRVRHGHGDLHLANIAVVDGEPLLFDCLEFSAGLASIDVLYDLAFLIADLWKRGLRTEANIVFNRYLDLSPEDEGGVRLMPLFLSVRMAIRAHVLAAASARAHEDADKGRSAAEDARACLVLAMQLLESVAPRLVAIGGLSGTGKSTVGRGLAGWIGRAPGARVLRSDILRKRLAGVVPETRLPADSYSREATIAVYDALVRMAANALECGQSVIADAVFAKREERDRIEKATHDRGMAFVGLWLELPDAKRIERISARSNDASDANAEVARQQAHYEVGVLGAWHRVQAEGPAEAVIARARALGASCV